MIRDTICSSVYRTIAFPVAGEYAVDALAYRSLRKSYISVMVPTVDLGLLPVVFCSMAMMGLSPVMLSTSGFSRMPMNCLAYAESVSIYLRCPSA